MESRRPWARGNGAAREDDRKGRAPDVPCRWTGAGSAAAGAFEPLAGAAASGSEFCGADNAEMVFAAAKGLRPRETWWVQASHECKEAN